MAFFAVAATVAAVGCGDNSTPVIRASAVRSEYVKVLSRLTERPALHMTVEIKAPPSVEGLSGRYEVDYEAPDKYRASGADGLLTIVNGRQAFRSLDGGSSWSELRSDAISPNPRDFFVLLTNPCSVERRSDGYSLELRSRHDTCGTAGAAMVLIDGGDIRTVELETPTDLGPITTALVFDLTANVEPIRSPVVA